jgi:hypothetical protein
VNRSTVVVSAIPFGARLLSDRRRPMSSATKPSAVPFWHSSAVSAEAASSSRLQRRMSRDTEMPRRPYWLEAVSEASRACYPYIVINDLPKIEINILPV